ncbi:hypothetical protein DB347_03885 [Opitutaceae bacterium EW11]|nr:hypothetical protein DB347_03885 [Opitutaceae bacterium EW11]
MTSSLVLRSLFVRALFAPALFVSATAIGAPIDRHAVVARHNVHVTSVDPEAALTVGNGDFAFTVDATGLQTFEKRYYDEGIPLETLCTLPWAWHSFPNTAGLKLEDAMKAYDFHGRSVNYAALQHSPAGAYFRENPHPLALGQISLLYKGQPVKPEEIGEIDQTLDLWTGSIRTTFTLAGQPVLVETAADPRQSAVAVRVRSSLVEAGAIQVRFRFPYSYDFAVRNKPPFDWKHDDRHQTALTKRDAHFVQLARTVDASRYTVNVAWLGTAVFEQAAPHEFRMNSEGGDALTFTCAFSADPLPQEPASFSTVMEASARGWADFWTKGAMIDLSGSTDPRAAELERRVVLSLYLTRVNYAGAFPPGETGLTQLSWYGKHNSEMYFWHAAHFYQWGHPELLEKGLEWYRSILPQAKADAAEQGFEGARWPKMAGIDGRPSPGTINPFIIWNQPNPIYLCELVYRAHPDRATLERYQDVVFESAKFLASFAYLDAKTQRYVLGPPIRNVSESSKENHTQNPTFELAYWHYGLQVAQAWRKRLGLAPEPLWNDILAKLAPLPTQDGKYVEIETSPDLYSHPGDLPTSMMMVLGYLPLTDKVDLETARRTFHELNKRSPQGTERWVSWALGQGALTAARLNEPATAVAIVTNPSKQARFMKSGHVRRPKEPNGCVTYLPVNSSLLTAVGLMAGGWDGAPKVNAPGFPQDGTWTVRAEGFNPMP